MIGWMVRKFISEEGNIVLEIYKTQIKPHIVYCTQASALVSRDWNGILELEVLQRRVRKIVKK